MAVSVPAFNKARVVVVGDVMLDRYWSGACERISPEAPVPVVKVDVQEDRLGGAANVALNIASLGGACMLAAIVGDDEPAHVLDDVLRSANVETLWQRSRQKTICKLRVMSRSQQLLRLDFEEPFAVEDSRQLMAQLPARLEASNVLVLSDYAKGSLQELASIIEYANKQGIWVLVDPKGNDFSKYRGASILTPNMHEFEAVVGPCSSEQVLCDKAQKLMAELNVKAILITRGAQGMTLIERDQQRFHLPAKARGVFDVTGAGDTVIATLASALSSGSDLHTAVNLANLAASIVVAKVGTVAITAPELRRAVQQEGGEGRGVLNLEQLILAVQDARQQGETIAFTNGCFDIIHAGHVGYLEQAKACANRLIVAVNSDASVRELKGAGRPINSSDKRQAVLAGLQAVDWVVEFTDNTPVELIQQIKPDVLVKGGDYSAAEVVGHELVEAYGGEVKVLGLWENLSTTAIVNKISQQHDTK